MGARNSKQEAKSITESLSRNIANTLSSINQSMKFEQIIDASCKDLDPVNCLDVCMENACKAGYEPNETLELCQLCFCTISDINFKQTILIDTSFEQITEIQQSIKTSIETTLNQLKTGGNNDQIISNASNNIIDNVNDLYKTIESSTKAVQIINTEDVSSIKGITFDQTIDVIGDFLQDDKVIQENINDIAIIITQENKGTLNWVIYAGIIIVILFILIFMILMLSKSKSLVEFFYKILPVLIFTVLAALITIIHVLFKPGYVSYTMEGEEKKRLDIVKLLMYLFLFYLGLGIIIWAIWKVKSKYKGLRD